MRPATKERHVSTLKSEWHHCCIAELTLSAASTQVMQNHNQSSLSTSHAKSHSSLGNTVHGKSQVYSTLQCLAADWLIHGFQQYHGHSVKTYHHQLDESQNAVVWYIIKAISTGSPMVA